MAKIQFNIKQLYAREFGIPVALPFPEPFIDRITPQSRQREYEGYEMDLLTDQESLAESVRAVGAIQFPVEFRLPVEIKRKTDTEDDWVRLPNEPIISIYGSKDIKTTTVQRLGDKYGTVKEERNLEDYRIRLQGIILNYEKKELPQEDIRAIRELCEHPGALNIKNSFLAMFNINQVTVNGWSFKRNSDDKIHYQRYEIDMWSDQDFDLEINE